MPNITDSNIVPAQILPTSVWNPRVPDVGRIWANTMLLSRIVIITITTCSLTCVASTLFFKWVTLYLMVSMIQSIYLINYLVVDIVITCNKM